MLRKLFGVVSLGIPACLGTGITIAWWIELGWRSEFTYIATVGCIIAWACLFSIINEKED